MSTAAFEPPQRYVPGRPPAPTASFSGHVTISRVDIMQTSKFFAAALTVLAIPSLFIGLAGGASIVGLMLLPVFHLIGGFIVGLLYSISYNLAARWVGGISFQVDRATSKN